MDASTALVVNAIIAGLLLGGFYAAVSVGISISFGMLDIVNIAHPGFIILGSYVAYFVSDAAIGSTTSASRSAARSRCAGSHSSLASCSSPRSRSCSSSAWITAW